MNKEQAAQLLRRAGCAGTSFAWDEGTIRDDVTDALKVYSTWPADEGEGSLLAAAPELARWGIEQAEEAERLRAELGALHARVAAVLAELQDMEAHHRQAEKSLAHGGYSFERAEAYEHAADLLKEVLNEQPNDGRACRVGGEE